MNPIPMQHGSTSGTSDDDRNDAQVHRLDRDQVVGKISVQPSLVSKTTVMAQAGHGPDPTCADQNQRHHICDGSKTGALGMHRSFQPKNAPWCIDLEFKRILDGRIHLTPSQMPRDIRDDAQVEDPIQLYGSDHEASPRW